MRGAFISVEGIDGSGKTTHIDFIENWLREHGAQVTRTREPGGTAVGELLREILLTSHVPISERCELMLMFAVRTQHLDEVIVPALNAGTWVLCERFIDSTYAYQGGGRGIDAQDIATLEKWVQRDLQPDLTVLLDVPLEIALARMRSRGNHQDRFEQQELPFQQAVQQVYQSRADRFKQRIRLVDASHSIAQVRAELATVLETFWQQRQT